MLDDLLIFNESGALLFNWHPEGEQEHGEDDLLSGFLTAINNFATFERGEDIKSLKLRETHIIFEKNDTLFQKLTFVVTTKNTELTELLHSFIHQIMDQFLAEFEPQLNKEFNGEITAYKKFKNNVNQIIYALGLDVLALNIMEIEKESPLKSVVYIEPKNGNIYYIHAKQYIDKEKLSFLIPLVLNSAKLLYQNYLNETLNWFLLNSVRSETIVVEPRKSIVIVKQFILSDNIENEFLSLEFFKGQGKYVKKPNKLVEKFKNIKWDLNIRQLYLVDLMGKILYSKIFDENYDCSDYIPEVISFLTSSKKAIIEINKRVLFYAAIGGEKILTICINFNNFALNLIGNVKDFKDFDFLQNICLTIYKQLK